MDPVRLRRIWPKRPKIRIGGTMGMPKREEIKHEGFLTAYRVWNKQKSITVDELVAKVKSICGEEPLRATALNWMSQFRRGRAPTDISGFRVRRQCSTPWRRWGQEKVFAHQFLESHPGMAPDIAAKQISERCGVEISPGTVSSWKSQIKHGTFRLPKIGATKTSSNGSKPDSIVDDVVALVTSLKAENKSLKEENERLRANLGSANLSKLETLLRD